MPSDLSCPQCGEAIEVARSPESTCPRCGGKLPASPAASPGEDGAAKPGTAKLPEVEAPGTRDTADGEAAIPAPPGTAKLPVLEASARLAPTTNDGEEDTTVLASKRAIAARAPDATVAQVPIFLAESAEVVPPPLERGSPLGTGDAPTVRDDLVERKPTPQPLERAHRASSGQRPALAEAETLRGLPPTPVDRRPSGRVPIRPPSGPLPEDDRALLAEVERASADPQRRFGRYVLLREIGEGGMGVVYQAWHTVLRRLVALKLLHRQARAPDAIERFEREAQAIARLRHPNIVAIHDAGTVQGTAYLIMDFVLGTTLKERVQAGSLPLGRGVAIVRDVARAVQYAHEQGVIHRDLKPQNIMLDREDKPCVLDFGLAKLAGAVTKLTASSVVLGTPGYMPPEQAGGSEFVDARSDVYALGSTLYYAICGRAPFEGNNAYQVLTEILRSPPLPPSSWNPEAEGPLDEICLRCLEKESDRRFQTAGELASVLDRYLVEKPSVPRRKPGAAKARRPSPAQEPPRRRSRWLVALPALLVGAGLGAGIRSLALTDSAPLQGEGEALGKALERALLRVAWTRVQVEDERLDDAIATLETFQREFGPTTAARELAPRLESLKRRAVGRALAGHGIEEAKLARTIALLDAYASDPEAASVASDAAARLADLRLVARQKVTWKKGSLSMCGTLAEGLSQVQDGETLRLESGEFSLPPVTIARSVRIEGAGLSRTRIVGKGDGFVLRFEGNGKLALSGITFEHKGAPSADVVVVAGGEVEIRGCAFTGLLDVPDVEPSAGRPTVRLVVREGGAGLRMTGSATGVVADCIFTRNSCGIVFAGQSSGSATHVTCTGNYFGLAVQGEATPSLRGCSCEKDHVGVIFLEQAAGTANGNECSSCYAGIAVAGTARPLASGNTCRKNVHGVVVCQSALPALERNACSENGQAGIDYQDEAAGTASSNLCSQNGVFGIRVADKGRPTLEKNICRENGESGLGFSGDAGGLATANTSVVNARFGVRMRERAQTVLRENFFFGNKEKDMSDERSR